MNILNEIAQRVEKLTSVQQEEMLSILKEWQKDKHREFKRVKTRAHVDVASVQRVVQTDMRDASASGIYINTSGKFEMDEKVKVVFSIPGYDKPFKISGVIVRVEKQGMAIKFEKITPYFKGILDDALRKGDPDSCE